MNSDMASIIIPCFNAVKYTKQCVESVLKYTDYDYELILINNGSTDGTEKYFRMLKAKIIPKNSLKKITIINMPKNAGVAKSLNLGISKSSGKYVCYLNNDVIVTQNWLGKMLRACNSNVKNAAVGTMFNAFENKSFIKAAEKDISKIAKTAEVISIINKEIVKKAKTIHGLCMLIKKEVFLKVGFFNESFYPCFGEDIEFCERLKKNGYNLVDAKDVFIFHYWNKSVRSPQFKEENESIEQVMKKHYKKFSIPKKYKI